MLNKGEWIEKISYVFKVCLLSQIDFFKLGIFNTILHSDFGISDFWKSQEFCVCIYQLLLLVRLVLLLVVIVVFRCWIWIIWLNIYFLYLFLFWRQHYIENQPLCHYGTYIGAVICKCGLWIIHFYLALYTFSILMVVTSSKSVLVSL